MKEKISLQIIKVILLFSFWGVWVFPKEITNLMKPLIIICTIFWYLKSSKKINKYLLIIYFYFLITSFLGIVNIYFNNLKYIDLFSFETNILFFFCLILIISNSKNKYIFNQYIKFSSLVLAIMVIVSNPIMGEINSSHINLLNISVNKNSISYLISPGFFIVINELQVLRVNNKEKIIYKLLQILILLYGGIYPMSRGGFLSLFLPLVINVVFKIKKKGMFFLLKKLPIFILLILIFVNFLPKQYFERLINVENYIFSNSGGRNILILEALKLVEENKIIGMGVGYYQKILNKGYGVHNIFVDIYIAFGIIGVVLTIILFIYPIIKKMNSKTVSWLIMAMIAAMIESQLSYQIWIPLAMSWANTYSFSKKGEFYGKSFNNCSCI